MARGRFLNRKISVSDKLNDLPDDTCRLLATWIIPYLDKNGVYYARPGIVKSTVFTIREDVTFAQVETYLQAMHDIKLICLFDGKDGKRYQYWPGFEDEQPNLRKDREKTDMPEPPDEDQCLALWDDGNCQATARQLPGNSPPTDSQQTGYLKANEVILQKTESEEKSTIGPSVPGTQQAEPVGGLPAPPSPLPITPPPPTARAPPITQEQLQNPDPDLARLWQEVCLPELEPQFTHGAFGTYIKRLSAICVEKGWVILAGPDHVTAKCRQKPKIPIQRTLTSILSMERGIAIAGVSFVDIPPGGT